MITTDSIETIFNEWYLIQISPTPRYSLFGLELSDDVDIMSDWCESNSIGKWSTLWKNDGDYNFSYHFCFKLQEDYTHFHLVWFDDIN